MKKEILIFGDGASRGNPGPGGYGVIISLPNGDVFELGGRKAKSTNNIMELSSAVSALEYLKKKKVSSLMPIRFVTDSSYLANGASKWVYAWQKNKWITSQKEKVLNKNLWQKILTLSKGRKINWEIVKGHSGFGPNERCDEIATSFADKAKIKLFSGKISDYGISLDEKPKIYTHSSSSKTNNQKKTAYSYVSLVNGVVQTHKTWAECEKRVKGVSATKYKKVFSAEEEASLIKEWSK
ncbi:MAG: viroplasmin family protein [Chitinophagaceae bacterium]|nr:viroplasmin family protein [Chitinophagaceae bacterium]